MKNTRNAFTWVALLSASVTAAYICRVSLSTAAPLVMKEFNLSQIDMGQIFSAFYLGYAIFQVPAGIWADRKGVTHIFRIIAWLWIVATLMFCLIGKAPWPISLGASFICLLVARFLLGVVHAPNYPTAAKGVSNWVPAKLRSTANGLILSSIGVGAAIAPLIVSNIMVAQGWRLALIAATLPAGIIAIIWLRVKPPADLHPVIASPIEQAVQQQQTSTTPLQSRSFILLSISYSLQGYVGYIFISWFYLYLVQERHFGLLTGAWMSSLPWILSICSIPLGGWLADKLSAGKMGIKWGRRMIPMLGLALSGIFIFIGAGTNNAIIAAITLAVATACILCVEGPFWSMMNHIAGNESGKAGGWMNMGCNICGLVSPLVTPMLATYIGWEHTLQLSAVLAIIASLLWLGISSPKHT